jgi:hypothetical protein
MISGDDLLRLLCIPIILGAVYWDRRRWRQFNRDHGLDIVKKLRRGASALEMAENAQEQEAFRRERIRALRERAATDQRAARELQSLLATQIRTREGLLRKMQASGGPLSSTLEAARSALMRDILELKGIQQEIKHLPGA